MMAAVERSKQFLLKNFQKNKSRCLNELRKENAFCDLTLKSEDGMEIRVHKVVVSSASNYFKDLIINAMKGEYDGCELPNISGNILEKIILFIYTNEFDEKLEDLEEIIKYAVLFQLEELVGICSLILEESISDENCVKYWRFARNNLIYDLEDKCLAYIADKADNLFEKRFLNDLTIEEIRCLLTEDRLRLQCNEQQIFEHVWKWTEGKVSHAQKFSEIFSEVVDLFRYSQLRDEFIFSRIFCNTELVDNGELLTKVAKLTNNKQNLQNKIEYPSSFVFRKPKLLGLGANKIFTGLEEYSATQIEEKDLPDRFAYTTFDTNMLLICGGVRSTACEYLEPTTHNWIQLPSMKNVKWKHECSYLGNKIYACGGYENQSMEIFELGREEWYNGPEMIAENYDFGLTAVNGALYAIGGKTNDVEIFDPRIQKWSVVNSDFSRKFDLTCFITCYTRCVSIGPWIYCFTDDKRYIFDTRVNKFIDEISCTDFRSHFNFCELDDYIYGFGYGHDPDDYSLKLVQYHLDGIRGYMKTIGRYDCYYQTALVALYY